MFAASPFASVPFASAEDPDEPAPPTPAVATPDPRRAAWGRRGADPKRTIAVRRRGVDDA